MPRRSALVGVDGDGAFVAAVEPLAAGIAAAATRRGSVSES